MTHLPFYVDMDDQLCNARGDILLVFADSYADKSRAILEDICRACNAHDDPLAACNALWELAWVHNARITDDTEALRKTCLAYAEIWNRQIMPAIAKAEGGGG